MTLTCYVEIRNFWNLGPLIPKIGGLRKKHAKLFFFFGGRGGSEINPGGKKQTDNK